MTLITPLDSRPMTPSSEVPGLTFFITTRAWEKIRMLGTDSLQKLLQVRVEGGGCAGFQYHMALVEAPQEQDILFQADDVQVCIDLSSLQLVSGSILDYEQDMMSAAFVIKNPNAVTSCGCGNSFSVM